MDGTQMRNIIEQLQTGKLTKEEALKQVQTWKMSAAMWERTMIDKIENFIKTMGDKV